MANATLSKALQHYHQCLRQRSVKMLSEFDKNKKKTILEKIIWWMSEGQQSSISIIVILTSFVTNRSFHGKVNQEPKK